MPFLGGLGRGKGYLEGWSREQERKRISCYDMQRPLIMLDLALRPGREPTSLQLSRHNLARWHGSSSGSSLINETTSLVMSSLGAVSCFSSGLNGVWATGSTHDILVALLRKAHILTVLLDSLPEGMVV